LAGILIPARRVAGAVSVDKAEGSVDELGRAVCGQRSAEVVGGDASPPRGM